VSQYGTIYRASWRTAQNDQDITVNIYDTEDIIDDAATPTVHTLTPTGSPLVVSTINNGKSKWGIFSKQARFEFYSTANYSATTFADSKDNRWLFEAVTDEPQTIFKGFLVLTDMSRPFLPNPQAITLMASDNLGLLKEKDLVTDADLTPTGKNRIADYLTWALAKTGLSLQIKTTSLVKHGTGTTAIDFANFSSSGTIFFPSSFYPQFYPGQRIRPSAGLNSGTDFTVIENNGGANLTVTPNPIHQSGLTGFDLVDQDTGLWLDVSQVDAKTFEKEIGTCEDCYTVIEKILDKDSFLVQYRGAWWIMRPDDFVGSDFYVSTFDTDGTFLDDYTQTTISKNVGEGEDQHFVNAGQYIDYERPYKFSKHTYRYESPLENPCNSDFSRGDLNATISATQKRYDLTCWTIRQGIGSGSASPLVTPYIERIFNNNGYEQERYAVIPWPSNSATALHYIESEPIPVIEKDRASFSIDYAWSSNASSGSSYTQAVACIRLEGRDGSHWTVDDDGVWYQSNAGWTTNFKNLEATWVPNDIDETEFRSESVEISDIPTDGDIYIMLYALNQQPANSLDNADIKFNNLNFSYIPYINGGYSSYSGQYSKYERSGDGYSANIDEEVNISDSPKPILKGAMFVQRGSVYDLTTTYHNAYPNNTTPVGSSNFMPFEQLRVLSTWNQYRISTGNKGLRYFKGDVYGLGSNWMDMVHMVSLTDADADSNGRFFMILSLEQDWRSCISSYQFAMTYHENGKVTDDDFEFKYIQD